MVNERGFDDDQADQGEEVAGPSPTDFDGEVGSAIPDEVAQDLNEDPGNYPNYDPIDQGQDRIDPSIQGTSLE